MLYHIATSRPVGQTCITRALASTPVGWEATINPEFADVFISVMYDTLVDERYISGVGSSGQPRRCYNFHPGLLPEYRGSGAFSWAIINGEKTTGVTLHELDVDIDHGPILDRAEFPILAGDTAGTLFARAMDLMLQMFVDWFPILLNGPPRGVPQDESKARIYYRRDLQAARDLTRFVRAFTFSGKPGAFYTDLDGTRHDLEL